VHLSGGYLQTILKQRNGVIDGIRDGFRFMTDLSTKGLERLCWCCSFRFVELLLEREEIIFHILYW